MNPIELTDFTGFRFLSGLRLTEDGSRAAFAVQESDLDKNAYRSDLWLWEPEGVRRLTSSGDVRSFCWLDGETLLFPSGREKKEEKPGEPETVFYSLSIRGGEAVKAFAVPLAVSGIRPLKDGRFVLAGEQDNARPDFSALTGEEKVKALEGYKEEQDYTVLDEIPFWSNGGGITNKKRSRLWIFSPGDGTLTPLTPPLMSVDYWELDPARERILYCGLEYENRMELTSGAWVYTISTGACQELLPPEQLSLYSAHFYGERILLLGSEGKRFGLNENPGMYWCENGRAELICAPDLSVGSSVGSDCRLGGGWSFRPCPEGLGITAIITDRACSRLADLTPEGTCTWLTLPEGSVDCFDRVGQVCLFIGMRGQGLQELYSLNLSTGEETCLTSFNQEALAGKYVAVPQPLSFRNEDGLELDGWVLLPRDYDPARQYPAILDIHGGPKTVYGTVYYHEMQLWASQGYFVFYCNPRGGDGRGDAFADIRGKYGAIDYADLMGFTDRVLEAYPAIDARRVGVTGGSYGGFMTNWIIGHTDRFAAAASQRSISNWISMGYTTDIGYYFAPDQTAATPWDNLERMWDQSPLKYADRCVTPTLFIHSDQDYRCWQAEALQMFTALKVHGVESRLCLFKGENHELSRSGKPKHRIRRLREITGWMDRHLK